ncbi:MAG: SDR family NAD(P)-dependent oxidoreductase [Myxococcota bacterium]|nr:SDR family NAD(P)-dependent oxidoreductase [Myxococcota bacterium]
MDVRNLEGQVGVVTGAGSGIGRALALALAARGADLSICDVDEQGLEETARTARERGRRVVCTRTDVSDAGAVADFAEKTWNELGRADVLVNNAGIGVGGPFVDVPLEEWETIVGINLKGVVYGCHHFVPRMIAAGHGGHVINIASSAGFIAAPGMSAYTATKFAVLGFSESLHLELLDHGIGVTAVCPGIINTSIVRTGRMYGPDATEERREEGVRAFERRNYTPERVAENVLRAVQRGRVVAPIAPEAWVFYYGKRFAPWLVRAFLRAVDRRQRRR